MNILLFLTLIVVSVSGIFAITRQFQMLQQNSYYPSRYLPWVRDEYSVGIALEAIAFCASSLLYGQKLYIAQLIFLCVILIIRIFFTIKSQNKSIKKLVLTSRVKRLYAASILVFVCFIALFAFLKNALAAEIFAVLTFMLGFISPLLTFLCYAITYPVEKAITDWYINDAKRILKEYDNLIVIGVTGSYGKTSVKFILQRILSEKYNVVATPQSFNTPMGVVRTIREKLKPQTQIFICEMGAKNPGDIKEICDIVHPEYGIITSVGAQHLETFKTIDNVFSTKFELANEVKKNNGEVFVNGDSKELISRIDTSLYYTYGTNQDFSAFASNISYSKNGSEFTLTIGNDEVKLSSKLLGIHNVLNITGAASLAHKLLLSAEDIKFATAVLKPTEHRLELKPFAKGSVMIDDAYNANPEGCIEAVHVLSFFEGMKKIIITPGLIELGSREYECNFALGVEAAKFCDIIILVGKNRSKPLRDGAESMNFPDDKLYIVSSFKEAMGVFSQFANKNTAVLLENDLPDNYLN